MKKKCQNCGTILRDEVNICPRCGTEYSEIENVKNNKLKKMLIILRIIAFILLLLVFQFIYWFGVTRLS